MLPVTTPNASCRAVEAISRSSKAIGTPCSAWPPSIRPASLAIFESEGVHQHVADQFIHKKLGGAAGVLPFGALNAVDQFHNGHHG
jgi:hypothetical protein